MVRDDRKRFRLLHAPAAGLLALGVLVLLSPRSAHAYLDAGTASLLFQALIATMTGGALLLKIYWRRVKTALGRAPKKEDEDPQEDVAL